MAASSPAARRRAEAEETTRRLLEAAAMEFVEHGYSKAVVSDIARRAGVTSGAVYARWPHKSDVMVAALDYIFEQILPEHRIKQLGLSGQRAIDVVALWGASLISSDATTDVFTQIFGSARNDPAVQERVQQFLRDQADQMAGYVDQAKEEGDCDPDHSTVALTLMIQAVGVGVHLLLSAGRDERLIPSQEEWTSVMLNMVGSVGPQPQQPQ